MGADCTGGVWRSIPACAGEPYPEDSNACISRVHPRVCGGALALGLSTEKIRGPSPRVRGSPLGVAQVGG